MDDLAPTAPLISVVIPITTKVLEASIESEEHIAIDPNLQQRATGVGPGSDEASALGWVLESVLA
jgi:hypothetical protein